MQLYHLTLAYPLDAAAEAELEALTPDFALFLSVLKNILSILCMKGDAA